MAYLDNSEIIVEAIITKKGRQKLASGEKLNITKFILGDDEIDYTLYNSTHVKGPTYYDSAIRGIPITEACSDENLALRYKLTTLPKSTTQIPIVALSQNEIKVNQNDGNVSITPTTSPFGNANAGYTMVLADQRAGTINVTESSGGNIPVLLAKNIKTTAQVVIGKIFTFIPNPNLTIDISTTITVFGNETGGSKTIPVIVRYQV
jgi:hypothetical protein